MRSCEFDDGAEKVAQGIVIQRAPGAAGPNVKKLAKIAAKSRRLEFSIPVTLPSGRAEMMVSTYGSRSRTDDVFHEKGGAEYSGDGPRSSLEAGLKWLADRWGHGTLDFAKEKVSSSKCPLKPKELDIRAKTLARTILFGIDHGGLGSAFDGPVYACAVSYEETLKPMVWGDVTTRAAEPPSRSQRIGHECLHPAWGALRRDPDPRHPLSTRRSGLG